jgi:predicted DNA-binding transcriptional regulator AlpA
VKKMNRLPDTFISMDEAAKLVGVHRTTLFSWIRKNKEDDGQKKIACPSYQKIGCRYRFKREDIEKFIKESVVS